MRELQTKLNRVRKIFRRRRTPENLELLQTVSTDVNNKLTVIRNETWLEWCAKMSQHTSLADIWRWLKRVGGKYSASQPIHPNPEQEAERLANMLTARTASQNLSANSQTLLERLTPARWLAINQACMREDEADFPYTVTELCNSYKKDKDTAPEWDKITYTMIRNLGPAGEVAHLRLINRTHSERQRPRAWNLQDTQPITKPKDPQNPRPIAFTSCLGKTAEKMVLERLKHRVGPLHPHLYAYQEEVGTTECITDVLSCINNKSALVAFLNFEKAFELENPAAILISLVRKGVKGHILAWKKNYLTKKTGQSKFQGTFSTYKDLENGTPQGGILSPYLFNLLMEKSLNLQLPRNVDIFIFADDVCVVVRGPYKVRTMQRALSIIIKKLAQLGHQINTNKTKAMMIKDRLPAESLEIDQTPIEWVSQYMYVGVIIDSQLKFNKEATHLRQRAAARLSTMKYMTSLKEGAKLPVQRTFYISCTRALIDYGAPTLTHMTDTQWISLAVL